MRHDVVVCAPVREICRELVHDDCGEPSEDRGWFGLHVRNLVPESGDAGETESEGRLPLEHIRQTRDDSAIEASRWQERVEHGDVGGHAEMRRWIQLLAPVLHG